MLTAHKKKGGLSPKRKGDAFEAEVAKYYRDSGAWCERIRQGQGEIVDLVAVEKSSMFSCHRYITVYFIQCRLRGNMTKKEREKLKEEAYTVSAVPILAHRNGAGQIVLEGV